jgi:hypothetical protein
MNFLRPMSGSTSSFCFQHIALLIAVCVTLPHTTHRVGDAFSHRISGCICTGWERPPMVDLDTVEALGKLVAI